MRMPSDQQWGLRQEDGNWTGTVGTLQRQGADFSMLLNWSYERRRVIDFTRIYAAEPLVIVSPKPRPLPRYLALVAPFSGEVWLALVVVMVWVGLVYWVLAWVREGIPCGEVRGTHTTHLGLTSAIFHTIALLLAEPSFKMPSALTTQMVVGWWCMFGLLMTATYKSSLIAYLSVPGRGLPVDSFEDLVQGGGGGGGGTGWTWGLEPTYGAEWEWFKSSSSPLLQSIFQGIEVLETEAHLTRVLSGRHALLTWLYYIRTIIASRYTDTRGYTPLHTSRTQYYVSTGYGWGFRKGAPFLRRVDKVVQRLLETGLVNHWLTQLIEESARDARMNNNIDNKAEEGSQGGTKETEDDSDDDGGGGDESSVVVLSLDHLQGALYILLLGCLVGLVALAGELSLYRRQSIT
ncbi:hypothetical protein Pmani_031957 [Petrolisthes manimaculis]|uniref:Uncharacterized protein n=1 Tax=Petrolisthes manimaculis TaxID=1843537 RepID=A0AAE1TRH1_9EUCA|nr:hypothetical protein Pmani_031957 [Petrolisthes manimaculis]